MGLERFENAHNFAYEMALEEIYRQVLDAFFDGEKCYNTHRLLINNRD